jgi:hypothetical protein
MEKLPKKSSELSMSTASGGWAGSWSHFVTANGLTSRHTGTAGSHSAANGPWTPCMSVCPVAIAGCQAGLSIDQAPRTVPRTSSISTRYSAGGVSAAMVQV